MLVQKQYELNDYSRSKVFERSKRDSIRHIYIQMCGALSCYKRIRIVNENCRSRSLTNVHYSLSKGNIENQYNPQHFNIKLTIIIITPPYENN